MDNNPQVQQPIPPQSIPPQNIPQPTNGFPKMALIIGGIIILILVVGFGGYLLGTKKNKTLPQAVYTQPSSSLPPKIASPSSASPTPDLATYTNPANFSLVYGKTNNIAYPSCSDEEKGVTGNVNLKIFEDLPTNTVYIGNETELISKVKTLPDGGEVTDYSTCQAVPNTLDLIKNGYNNGSKSSENISHPSTLKYQYKKIMSDADLVSFAQSVFGNGCTTIKKTLVANQTNVYSVKVSDKNGSTDMNSGCGTNYAYDFMYSTKDNVAVAGALIQNCPYSSHPNGDCEAQITFP